MRVLITGPDSFLGRNLTVRLSEMPDMEVVTSAGTSVIDAVVHLAPADRSVMEAVVDTARRAGRLVRVIEPPTPPPDIFGKWRRPSEDRTVATFCYNAARGLPLEVDDPSRELTLVHVDDVMDLWIRLLQGDPTAAVDDVAPVYRITEGELAAKIQSYRDVRRTFVTERVGAGLDRALYSTYVSYLPPQAFAYALPMHADPRGVFVEFLKTHDSGQFSFFIAKPGVTRGGHYHHTKTEKFLVIQGCAVFRFRHIVSDETHEVSVSGDVSEVVETVPGWAHDITNVGDEDLVVILWANEVFDRSRPDTVASRTR